MESLKRRTGEAALVFIPPFAPAPKRFIVRAGALLPPFLWGSTHGFICDAMQCRRDDEANFRIAIAEQLDQLTGRPGLGDVRNDPGGLLPLALVVLRTIRANVAAERHDAVIAQRPDLLFVQR